MNKERAAINKKRRPITRTRSFVKFQLTEEMNIDYKNIPVLQKFLNDRGKMMPRRITGVNAKQQRALCIAIKRARFLALLPSGSSR